MVRSAARATPDSGEIVPGWNVEALLASSLGTRVYAATHRHGRRAALKLLACGASEERFLREVALTDAASTIGSPKLFGYGIRDDGAPYLLLELLSGHTLEQHSSTRGGRFDLATALLLAERLLAVASELHQIGITHRDIHPQNIFLTAFAEVRLLDYSEAARPDLHRRDSQPVSPFVAPEQRRGAAEPADPRSDVYAVGAVLYWLLTGCVRPLLQWATGSAPELPFDGLEHLPYEVLEFLELALALEPGRRLASATIMRATLLSMHASLGGLSRDAGDTRGIGEGGPC